MDCSGRSAIDAERAYDSVRPQEELHDNADEWPHHVELDLVGEPIIMLDEQMRLVDTNRAADQLFGFESRAWVGRIPLELVHPDDMALVDASFTTFQTKEIGTAIEIRIKDANGRWRLVELVGRWNQGAGRHGSDLAVLSLRDMTQRRHWELASGDEQRFRTLVQHAGAVVALVDITGKVHSITGALIRQLGRDPEDAVGKPFLDLVTDNDRHSAGIALDNAMVSDTTTVFEAMLDHHDGRNIPYQFTVVNLLDDPVVGGLIISGHDITSRVELEERLAYLAGHDPLTGLANRSRLHEHLKDVLGGARQDTVLLLVDLDRFKPINDLHGHDIGDEVLKRVASRLTHCVRDGDLVCRYGGDEFVLVVNAGASQSLVDDVEHRVAEAVRAPITIRRSRGSDDNFEMTFTLEASIGVVRPGDAASADELLAEADASMYRAKHHHQQGRPLEAVSERRRIARELTTALAEPGVHGLIIYYQPIVVLAQHGITHSGELTTASIRDIVLEDDSTLQLIGFEALVRWDHPRLGMLGPDRFLHIAHDAGLDSHLGAFVLTQATSALAEFQQETDSKLAVAVNLAARQCEDPALARTVETAIEHAQIAPEQLWLEVTETALLQRFDAQRLAELERICASGVKLAIDDFGTGNSSLVHVRDLPASLLKIDRSFVEGLTGDATTRVGTDAIIEAVVNLAHATGKQVVAEGVSQAQHHDILTRLGVDYAQGYLYAMPQSKAEVVEAMRQQMLLGQSTISRL